MAWTAIATVGGLLLAIALLIVLLFAEIGFQHARRQQRAPLDTAPDQRAFTPAQAQLSRELVSMLCTLNGELAAALAIREPAPEPIPAPSPIPADGPHPYRRARRIHL
jgi:hypothetical protein